MIIKYFLKQNVNKRNLNLRMGTDSGDHFRAESRDKSNEVQGVYGWIDPSGSTHTIGKL